MFTGIIETLGTVESIREVDSNLVFEIGSKIGNELKVDQSVSHNGVCLTVTKVDGFIHTVTGIRETLEKSNLRSLKRFDKVNLERSMLNNGRFDGHLVQGHVDQTGICISKEDQKGSWVYNFEYDLRQKNITIEKGSICINGVSLTCFDSGENRFRVAIIPYTFENTNFQSLSVGDVVNLEFDMVGKYIQKIVSNGKY